MMQVNFGTAMAFSYIESRLKIVVIHENVFVSCPKYHYIELLRHKDKLYIFSNLNIQVQNMSMNVVR